MSVLHLNLKTRFQQSYSDVGCYGKVTVHATLKLKVVIKVRQNHASEILRILAPPTPPYGDIAESYTM